MTVSLNRALIRPRRAPIRATGELPAAGRLLDGREWNQMPETTT